MDSVFLRVVFRLFAGVTLIHISNSTSDPSPVAPPRPAPSRLRSYSFAAVTFLRQQISQRIHGDMHLGAFLRL